MRQQLLCPVWLKAKGRPWELRLCRSALWCVRRCQAHSETVVCMLMGEGDTRGQGRCLRDDVFPCHDALQSRVRKCLCGPVGGNE